MLGPPICVPCGLVYECSEGGRPGARPFPGGRYWRCPGCRREDSPHHLLDAPDGIDPTSEIARRLAEFRDGAPG